MAAKEAKARIKINKLLEEADWRFFDDVGGKANEAGNYRERSYDQYRPRPRLGRGLIIAQGPRAAPG